MTTSCQVKVDYCHFIGDKPLTLFHESAGNPTDMLPLLYKAYHFGETFGKDWTVKRVGASASYLCVADPGVFCLENGNTLREDIEFYYIVTVGGKDWIVETFRVRFHQGEIQLCLLHKLTLLQAVELTAFRENSQERRPVDFKKEDMTWSNSHI